MFAVKLFVFKIYQKIFKTCQKCVKNLSKMCPKRVLKMHQSCHPFKTILTSFILLSRIVRKWNWWNFNSNKREQKCFQTMSRSTKSVLKIHLTWVLLFWHFQSFQESPTRLLINESSTRSKAIYCKWKRAWITFHSRDVLKSWKSNKFDKCFEATHKPSKCV
jgi:hypothetical protein